MQTLVFGFRQVSSLLFSLVFPCVPCARTIMGTLICLCLFLLLISFLEDHYHICIILCCVYIRLSDKDLVYDIARAFELLFLMYMSTSHDVFLGAPYGSM